MSVNAISSDPLEGGADGLSIWAYNHEQHHRDINTRIASQYGVTLDNPRLDPIDLDNMQNWLYTHQKTHDDINRVLGTNGTNLSQTDWDDDIRRDTWLWQHQFEHQRFAGILGV